MATIHREIMIDAPCELAWQAVRDVGAVHTRLAKGFVTDTTMDGDARIVTFHNGLVVREIIVTVDEARRRLVWAVVGTQLQHHNASLQLFAAGASSTRVVWIADLLPDDMAGRVAGMIEDGMAAMKATLEANREHA